MLFCYQCCPHTSTGEAPYTLVYNSDPPIPIHKLIKVVEPYMGENTLGRRIEQSRVSLSIAAKMLEKMRANQKRYYKAKVLHLYTTFFYLSFKGRFTTLTPRRELTQPWCKSLP